MSLAHTSRPYETPSHCRNSAQSWATARHLTTLLEPHSPVWIHVAWQALAPSGERAAARDMLVQYATRAPSDMYRALTRFLIAALDGDATAAAEHMTPAVEGAASFQEHLARMLADAYAQLGRTDDALRWLRASVHRGMIHYPFFTPTCCPTRSGTTRHSRR